MAYYAALNYVFEKFATYNKYMYAETKRQT